MMAVCLWATSGCGPLIRSVNSGPAAAPPADPPWMQACGPTAVLGQRMQGWQDVLKGPCQGEPGQRYDLGGASGSTGPLVVKLNVLAERMQPGEDLVALADVQGSACVTVGRAAFYGTQPPAEQCVSGAVEFPRRWKQSLQVPPRDGTTQDLELRVRCASSPCTVGRVGFIRRPK